VYSQAEKSTVFRRYNIAIVVAFVVIILIALSVASLRYFDQLARHKQLSSLELKQEVKQLNGMLEQSVQAIEGIQELAEYSLKNPKELDAKVPSLAQDGEFFYLDKVGHDVLKQGKRISGNITGIGRVSQFDIEVKQELAMANALTPAFVSAQKIIQQATWFYYLSFSHFVNIYPWVDRDIWQFNEKMINNPRNIRIQKLAINNNRVIWSAPYLDSAGGGMNASLAKGVFQQEKLLGAIVVDINLTRLHASLPDLESTDQGLVLYNQNNQILLFKRSGKEALTHRSSWQDLLPESLSYLNANRLAELESAAQLDDWYVEKQELSVNGWTLLKYQHFENLTAPLRSDFAFVFSVLFIGLLAFLMLVNSMTKRTFIKPTTEFIRHIGFCAQGDYGKVKPSPDWLHWFQVVEELFTQNSSLLLQLTEQRDALDSRVVEKTQALQETSAKHQRDYALLRSVINAMPELIIFNDPQGLLMGCNQAFERITDHQETQMLGVKAANFMPKALAKEINYFNSIDDYVYPQQVLIEAGELIYQGFCNQFQNVRGDILGTISIFRDVTEQQATQSALEKAKNQAEHANKVKIQFLANMSHEVRTPINAMQGMMGLLTGTPLDSRQHHYLLNAQSAASTLLHLIDELLDLSKIEAGKMLISHDEVSLPEIIDRALKLNITNVDSSKVKVSVDLSADLPCYVFSDEMRLVQVLANLFNNAIKFTEHGEVKLIVDTIALSQNDALVRFKMTDTGIGIAADKQGILFNAFTQADDSMTRKYGGSGLGLSICQHIIKLLGGEISLKSTLGQGSELSFVLPFKRVIKKELAQQKLLTGIHICAIKQDLSATLIDTINHMAGQFSAFSSLVDFCQQQKLNPSIGKVVLLIDEETFTQQQSDECFSDCQNKIALLGLCQPVIKQLNSLTCQYLEQLTIPYLMLDMPLFSISLMQIQQALTIENAPVAMVKIGKGAPNENPFMKVNIAEPKKLTQESDKSRKNVANNLFGIKVLLVEDNLVNQLVAKELLHNMQAQVTIADNGQCALDILDGKTFDVILMDIQMPIMDGLTAAKQIRAQVKYQDLPIIAMTAHARAEDKAHSLAAGMNLHMPKPVTGKVLFDSIKQVLVNA